MIGLHSEKPIASTVFFFCVAPSGFKGEMEKETQNADVKTLNIWIPLIIYFQMDVTSEEQSKSHKNELSSENGNREGVSGNSTGKPMFSREVRRLSMGMPITHFEVHSNSKDSFIMHSLRRWPW